jgi:hypothetical protein
MNESEGGKSCDSVSIKILTLCAGVPVRVDRFPSREERLAAHGAQRDASLPNRGEIFVLGPIFDKAN